MRETVNGQWGLISPPIYPIHVTSSVQEYLNVTVRAGGSLKKRGLPTELLVPIVGPVSGTRRIAWLKASQAFRTSPFPWFPKLRAAMALSNSSSGGASLQPYQARSSAIKLGVYPVVQLSSVPFTPYFSSALYLSYHWYGKGR